MPFAVMKHDEDPKTTILKEVGDVSEVEIFNNQILLATYERPEKTASGIYLTDKNRDEDKFQSKVGLVIKMGPDAFVDTDKWVFKASVELNDWAIFRPSDGWNITVNGKACRIVDDTNIRGRVAHPDQVW